MRTYVTREKQIKRSWHLIDAEGQILGRLASKVSNLLMGKNKRYYSPHLDCGDQVVVINAKKIKLTGKKEASKIYYRHSGYPGGLKQEELGKLLERRPEEVIRRAISGMLPKNKLRDPRLRRLNIYKDESYPQVGQLKVAVLKESKDVR